MVSNIKSAKLIVKKDYQGNDLTIGTTVIFMEIGYRNFLTGVLCSMGEKKGTITRDNGRKAVQFYNQMIRANHG